MIQISEKQREEWTENPVTIKLKELFVTELEKILNTPILDCLCYGEPNKTQESLINLEARGDTALQFVEALDGDWSYFEEIEDDSYAIEDEVDE